VPEWIPYLAFVVFRIPLPLTIIQILAVDLGTDMLPSHSPGPMISFSIIAVAKNTRQLIRKILGDEARTTILGSEKEPRSRRPRERAHVSIASNTAFS
jgi:hypothetical protein